MHQPCWFRDQFIAQSCYHFSCLGQHLRYWLSFRGLQSNAVSSSFTSRASGLGLVDQVSSFVLEQGVVESTCPTQVSAIYLQNIWIFPKKTPINSLFFPSFFLIVSKVTCKFPFVYTPTNGTSGESDTHQKCISDDVSLFFPGRINTHQQLQMWNDSWKVDFEAASGHCDWFLSCFI